MGLFCLFPRPGIPEFPCKHHRQGFTFIGGQLRPSHHVVPGKKGNGTLGNNTISPKNQDQSQPRKAIKIQKKSGSTSAKVSFSSSPNSRTEGARLENLVLSSSEEPSTPIPSPIPSPIPTIPGYWMGGALHRCKALDLF